MSLNIIPKSISELISDPKNARLHSDRNLDSIKRSLKKFGQQKPIVIDQRGQVVAGNGTLRAASELGWNLIDVVVTELSEEDAMAYAIADNRTAELAEWDYESLGERMKELNSFGFDLADAGWEPFEAEPLLQAEWKKPDIEKMPDTTSTSAGEKSETDSVAFNDAESGIIKRAVARWKSLNPEGKDKSDSECIAQICLEWIDSVEFLNGN